jgi:hypothetical protein
MNTKLSLLLQSLLAVGVLSLGGCIFRGGGGGSSHPHGGPPGQQAGGPPGHHPDGPPGQRNKD